MDGLARPPIIGSRLVLSRVCCECLAPTMNNLVDGQMPWLAHCAGQCCDRAVLRCRGSGEVITTTPLRGPKLGRRYSAAISCRGVPVWPSGLRAQITSCYRSMIAVIVLKQVRKDYFPVSRADCPQPAAGLLKDSSLTPSVSLTVEQRDASLMASHLCWHTAKAQPA